MLKFCISIFLSFFPLNAQEPVMATLISIISNDIQEFKIKNYKFFCSPYGIISIDRLYINAKPSSVCRESIFEFYQKRKNLKYFLYEKLHLMQSYSIRFKDETCIISMSGEKTLSEFLLDEGLAFKKQESLDPEYDFYFYKAQKIAKALKKGLWSENISQVCEESLKK